MFSTQRRRRRKYMSPWVEEHYIPNHRKSSSLGLISLLSCLSHMQDIELLKILELIFQNAVIPEIQKSVIPV